MRQDDCESGSAWEESLRISAGGILEGRVLALKTTAVRDTEQMRTPSEKYQTYLSFTGKPRLDSVAGVQAGGYWWVSSRMGSLQREPGGVCLWWKKAGLVMDRTGWNPGWDGLQSLWHGEMKHLLVLRGRSSTFELGAPTVGSVFSRVSLMMLIVMGETRHAEGHHWDWGDERGPWVLNWGDARNYYRMAAIM